MKGHSGICLKFIWIKSKVSRVEGGSLGEWVGGEWMEENADNCN